MKMGDALDVDDWNVDTFQESRIIMSEKDQIAVGSRA